MNEAKICCGVSLSSRRCVSEHNHPPDSSQLREARLKNALKQRVRSEPHLPAPQVYSREILSLVGQVSKNIVSSLHTMFYYTRIRVHGVRD